MMKINRRGDLALKPYYIYYMNQKRAKDSDSAANGIATWKAPVSQKGLGQAL
jgi:hypothetical protein